MSSKESKLKVEYVSIDEIKPYAGNAKKHPQEQIEQIKKSIELMGFDDPIAIWKNGEIIEGHGRLIAAQELGMKEVPIIRLDNLSDEQRRAYALIHNKLTMNSGFDLEILGVELSSIEEVDMEQFSFTLDADSEDLYVDDFFDRGVEAKDKPVVHGIKIECDTEEEAEELKDKLEDEGYTVKLL